MTEKTHSPTSITPIKKQTDEENVRLLKPSDFLPILKTCIYIIFIIIFFSFGSAYLFHNISPDSVITEQKPLSSQENI